MDIEDRTAQYAEEVLKVGNREESIDLRKKIKPTHSGADSVLAIADNIVDRKIANVRTEDAAAYSTVTIKLYENKAVKAEILANEDLTSYNLPLLKRVGLALSNGWSYFTELIIGLLHLWPFIAAIVAGSYAVVVYRKKKSLKQLPS